MVYEWDKDSWESYVASSAPRMTLRNQRTFFHFPVATTKGKDYCGREFDSLALVHTPRGLNAF